MVGREWRGTTRLVIPRCIFFFASFFLFVSSHLSFLLDSSSSSAGYWLARSCLFSVVNWTITRHRTLEKRKVFGPEYLITWGWENRYGDIRRRQSSSWASCCIVWHHSPQGDRTYSTRNDDLLLNWLSEPAHSRATFPPAPMLGDCRCPPVHHPATGM